MREVRGLNYDSLKLSSDPDPCKKPDPDTAVIWRGMGPTHTPYRFVGDELHIYDVEDLAVPKRFADETRLVIHQVSNPQYIMLRDARVDKGLDVSVVPLNSDQICW